MSIYQDKTATEREALASARKVGEEAPKCAAYFDHSADCDLFRSHFCGPDPLAVALGELFRGASEVTVTR